jgi:tetratricopeptide (TPR) repeat protein
LETISTSVGEIEWLLRQGRLREAWSSLDAARASADGVTALRRVARLRVVCARRLGQAAQAAGNLDDAEAWWRAAAALAPDLADVQIGWGRALTLAGRPHDGWVVLRECEPLVADGEAALAAKLAQAQAFCASKLGWEAERPDGVDAIEGVDWDEVLYYCAEAARLAPDNPRHSSRYVLALLYGERFGEAEDVERRITAPEMAPAMDVLLGQSVRVMAAQRRGRDFTYAAEAPRYLARGLPVVPTFGKRAIPARWDRWCEAMPDVASTDLWMKIPWAGIGMVVGPQSGVSIIDIDAKDPATVAAVEAALPPSPWRRVGRYGMALAYRSTNQPGVRCHEENGDALFDLMTTRRLIVLPPSVHPGSGESYHATAHLADVLDQLAPLPDDFAQRLVDVLAARGVACHLVWPGAR